jgi:mannose PTS system EIID component
MTELPASIRVRMLLRSLAVQGSWNYETLIGAGFAFTLLPALRLYYGNDGDQLDAAVSRHAELFNSHPYFATVAAGAVARLEAERAQPAVIERFKIALRGSLGSMGDRLVWTTWRPMALLLAIVLFLLGAAWWVAVGVFLIVYNALHFAVRVVGLRIGISAGLEVGRVLREAPLQPVINRASQFASLLIGAGIVLVATPALRDPSALAATAAAVSLGLFLGFRTRRVMIAVLTAATILALALGLTGHGP